MAELTVQKTSLAGLGPTFVPAQAGGDTFENDGRTWLHVKNGGGSALTVQIDASQPCNFGFDHDASVSVPAGGERLIGPFPRERFGSKPNITYPGGVTSLTIAAIRLGA